LSERWTPTESGDGNAPVEDDAAADATLNELAEKLSELRRHLEQVVIGLNESRDDGRVVRDSYRAAGTGRRAGNSRIGSGFRCHACGRTRSSEDAGWTLRLCGDDVLHTFCPDCDGGYVSGDRSERRVSRPVPRTAGE
jgi:hypothetical protein